MKRTLLSLSFLLILSVAQAQVCTPDPIYADSVYGVWPDTTTNFVGGIVGETYFQQLDLLAPADASLIDPDFNVVLHSFQLTDVTGMPPGLTYQCASTTCTFLVSQLGCGVIQGTPTQAGIYELTLQVLPYVDFLGNPIPSPFGALSFTGYRIQVTEGVGITEFSGPGLGQVRNIPNPFANRTAIEFHLAKAGEVKVRVFNLLGDELWNQHVQGRVGQNRLPFESGSLPDGVYLYKVETGKDAFTGRMVLSR